MGRDKIGQTAWRASHQKMALDQAFMESIDQGGLSAHNFRSAHLPEFNLLREDAPLPELDTPPRRYGL